MTSIIEEDLKQNYKECFVYYISLSRQEKFKFRILWKLSDETKDYLINCIKQIGEGKILIFSMLFERLCKELFNYNFKYYCNNQNCKSSEDGIKTNKLLKSCPTCKSSLDLTNKDKLENCFKYYINQLDFFILSDERETIYLIYCEENKSYYIKKGNNNLKDFVLFQLQKIKDFNMNYLKFLYGDKLKENLLLQYIKENNYVKCINDVNFKPTNELFFQDDEKIYFNKYKGNEYLNLVLDDNDKKLMKTLDLEQECPNIYLLLNNLVGFDKKGLKYFIDWISYIFNNPHSKSQKALILFGNEGTGKGILSTFVLAKLFNGYFEDINSSALDTPFNDFLTNNIITVFQETKYNKDHEDRLKNWVTEEKIYINTANGKKGTQKNYSNLIMTSNNSRPAKIGDRRTVYFYSRVLGGDKLKSAEIGSILVKNIPNELLNFAKYLKYLNIEFDTINKGYDSQIKRDVLNSCKSIEERFLDEMFSYLSFDDFIKSLCFDNNYKNEILEIKEINGTKYIIYNFFLECYNKFLKEQSYKGNTSSNRFSWFLTKLNISKENKKQVIKTRNIAKKTAYYINLDLIDNMYKDNERKEVLN